MWDAVLTCAKKPTRVSLIYRTVRCADRQRRQSARRPSCKAGASLGANTGLPRDPVPRDRNVVSRDYVRPRRRAECSSVADLSGGGGGTLRRCGCPLRHEDSFASISHSSTFLAGRTADHFATPPPHRYAGARGVVLKMKWGTPERRLRQRFFKQFRPTCCTEIILHCVSVSRP